MLTTAGSAFIVSVAAILSSGVPIEWSYAFWFSVLLAGGRAVVKAIVNQFVAVRLGGKKVE